MKVTFNLPKLVPYNHLISPESNVSCEDVATFFFGGGGGCAYIFFFFFLPYAFWQWKKYPPLVYLWYFIIEQGGLYAFIIRLKTMC